MTIKAKKPESRRIFRYTVPYNRLEDITLLHMPVGASVLSAISQQMGPDEHLVICAEVFPNAPMEWRKFRVVGTGNPIEIDEPIPTSMFVDSVQFNGGALVFHVYDLGPSKETQ